MAEELKPDMQAEFESRQNFQEGKQAFIDGLGRNRNPHADPTSAASKRWDDGWTWMRDQ